MHLLLLLGKNVIRKIIRTSFLGKFFSPIRQMIVTTDYVEVQYKNQETRQFSYQQSQGIAQHQQGFWGSRFSWHVAGQLLDYSLLNQEDLNGCFEEIVQASTAALNQNLTQALKFFQTLAVQQYLRESSLAALQDTLVPLLQNYVTSQSIWQKQLHPEMLQQLDQMLSYLPLDQGKSVLRQQYEQQQLQQRQSFFEHIESNPLTEQQRLAVIRNDDRNLVLAAAGTGKTSVMVAKALDLIDSGLAHRHEILILAYNNAAAKELRERLQKRSQSCGIAPEDCPEVMTFHALGRSILQQQKISTHLSVFTEDPTQLEIWMTEWLSNYIQSDPDGLSRFIELSYQPVNAFDFKTKAEYDRYVRDHEYRTLQGERVRGYQELLIANWLFLHGIAYQYEAPYITKRRIELGFDYRPDFYLTDAKVYLEHFGIDRQGKTRADIPSQEYNAIIRKKRELHQSCGTTLLETYHYDWTENRLEQRLSQLMQQHQIPVTQKSAQEVFEVLNQAGMISSTAKRYLKGLAAIRVERLDRAAILKRLQQQDISFAGRYADLLDQIHQAYCKKLQDDCSIDFDDMILQATDLIQPDAFHPQWKHILVDEFQDISMARMLLLQALIQQGPSPILTVVGDDWQSIYRFSGGKLELTTRFADLIGSHSLTKLEKTYRYNNSIALTAGRFVMQNPEQYQKNVVTAAQVEQSAVYLLDSHTIDNQTSEDQVVQLISKIRQENATASIAVLARYRYLLDNVKGRVRSTYANIAYCFRSLPAF
ncbi:UvrD-helicase domain-containing protein [Acinetobacter sp. ANC 5502]